MPSPRSVPPRPRPRSVPPPLPVTHRPPAQPVERWEDVSAELWEVQGSSRVRLMTLDELDAAFKADEIGTNTLVRRPGTVVWKTLAEIAGIDASTPMLESESLVPVASDIALPEVPKAPPVPVALELIPAKVEPPITSAELSAIKPHDLRGKLTSLAVVLGVGSAVFFGVSGFLSVTEPLPAIETATASPPAPLATPTPALAPASAPAASAVLELGEEPIPAAAVLTATPTIIESSAVLRLAQPAGGIGGAAASPSRVFRAKVPARTKPAPDAEPRSAVSTHVAPRPVILDVRGGSAVKTKPAKKR